MVMNVISESLVITAINKLKWIHCPQQRAWCWLGSNTVQMIGTPKTTHMG
jgi:hypothetical protein